MNVVVVVGGGYDGVVGCVAVSVGVGIDVVDVVASTVTDVAAGVVYVGVRVAVADVDVGIAAAVDDVDNVGDAVVVFNVVDIAVVDAYDVAVFAVDVNVVGVVVVAVVYYDDGAVVTEDADTCCRCCCRSCYDSGCSVCIC